jgi:hypothetical protein
MSFGFLCCVVFWLLVVGFPILLTLWLGGTHLGRQFKLHVRSLRGQVVRESSESIEVQLPGETGMVAAAFFPRGSHWFGRQVLEMHFALPSTGAQLFICGNQRLVRNLPAGWLPWTDPLLGRHANVIAASATPERATTYFAAGLLQAYFQLNKIHPNTIRLAIGDDQLILLISEFSNTATELSNLLVFGNQLVKQLEIVQSGQIQLTDRISLSATDAQCPICFSPVVQPIECERCRTPHCRDCWSYNGNVCGVFGCGGHPADHRST